MGWTANKQVKPSSILTKLSKEQESTINMVCKGCGTNCQCSSQKCGDNCSCNKDCNCVCKTEPKDQCCSNK